MGNANIDTATCGTDKAIARLLYAMLMQRSLKDIDWNQVARDPALLEDISNGHAARMRFSRFRTVVEKETKRRARLSDSSTVSTASAASISSFRVTKSRPGTQNKIGRRISSRGKQGQILKIEEDDDCLSFPPSPPKEEAACACAGKRRTVSAPVSMMKGFATPQGSPSSAPLPYFLPSHSAYGGHALVRNVSSGSAPDLSSQLRMRHPTPYSDDAPTTTFDFDAATATVSTAAVAAAHYGSVDGRQATWMCLPNHHGHLQSQLHQLPSPFSPPMGVFDMGASVDPVRLSVNHFCQGNLHEQQQQQQEPQQDSIRLPGYAVENPGMPIAFARHGVEWNNLLGQASSHESQDQGEPHFT